MITHPLPSTCPDKRLSRALLLIKPRLARWVAVLGLCWSAACPAAIHTVTSASDTGAGTLRQAILSAVAGDTINFAAGISTITLTSAELLLSKDVTISGPGPNLLTVQTPAHSFRIFDIASATVSASISGLTIANGGAYDADNYGGAGIHNGGVLTLTNCALSNNYSGNGAHGGGDGGAIINLGVLTMTDCTLSGNSADWYGGGLYNYGMATLNNCTVSGNTSASGAGIYTGNGSVTVTNCTISTNTTGGGVVIIGSGTVFTAKNSIIALNTARQNAISPTIVGSDVSGSVSLTSQGSNLVGINMGTITPAQTSDHIGTTGSPINPLLGPLQDNGGRVFTCALLTGSPAIDAGDDSVLNLPLKLATDQRGTGFGRKVGAHVDIGAYEFGAGILPPVVTTVAASGVTFDGATLKGTVNASNSSTAVSFDYGTSVSYGTNVMAAPSPVTGGSATAVSFALTSLTPNTLYHYRVNGTASFVGTVNGKDLTFITLDQPPTVVGDIIEALPSAKVAIDVLANDSGTGGALTVYSFTQPGSVVGTVARLGTKLVFMPSATFTGGFFTYIAADAYGGRSPATAVTLNPGTCSCASFLNAASDQGTETFQVMASAPFTVTGKPAWLSFNPILTGDTQVTFVFTPNPALSSRMGTIVVGGNPVTVTQFGVAAAPVLTNPTTIPNAAISANYDLAIPTLNGPVTYTAIGLPTGLTLSNITGHITGTPTVAVSGRTVTIVAKNVKGTSNVISFAMNVLAFPSSLQGGWSATVERNGGVNTGSGGLLSFTVAANGPVTGTLKSGAASYPFAGRLNTAVDPSSPDPLHPRLTVAIPHTSLVLVVNLNSPNAGYIAGTVTLGASIANLSGAQQVWSLAGHLAASDYSGSFTTALQPTSSDASIPQGDGFLTFSVSATGVISWSGQLADGTVIVTGSSALWPGGEVPLYASLYTGKGSLLGAPVITAITRVLTGNLSWSKNAQPATARAYGAGFGALNPVSLALLGGGYAPLPAVLTVQTGSSPPIVSAQISFADGGIGIVGMAGKLTQPLTISATNVATLPTIFGGNPANIKITSINAAHGTFIGSLTLKDTNPFNGNLAPVLRAVNFNGVFLQKANNIGTGYFLLPAITGPPANVTTSPETSGQVLITPST